ncbi:HesB/YadR/YfhF family protein [Bacillus solimangrovi]|uniref:Core domain-containing protein n=1 Tax=Bacillus solimangrovi TaxID=1305675 RepID=A0A1E5LEI0_9BACI|nr:HesB/YadR/YfhF family protein [Bacillus solimangrovi]OEH92479.1 hypothetical protein BFG57_15580 [Bacillus solimangrovi]
MKLEISSEAVEWYKDEMELDKGDTVRFFVRYGGNSTIQKGFSLGVMTEEPIEPFTDIEVDGITFYIEEKDAWYFDEYDLNVQYNNVYDEVEFDYKES